jgi:hypothetical protein
VPELDKRFDDPPRSFSPVPIWWWSGEKLDAQRLRWQLERFAQGGVYNLLIMNLAPSGPLYGSDPDDPPFFSEEWWTLFRGACEDAQALGIHLWFYDQFGFSGANMQARLVTQHPTVAGQSLQRVSCDVPATGVLECPEAGTPLAACVIPIDEQGQPAGEPLPVPMHGRSVTWHGSGTHRLMLFYSIESGFDYFNVSACQALLAMVHGAYEAHVGDFFGNVIVGTFQDELAAMPMWSRDFAEAFRARCGYDLLAHLPALWEDYGEQAERVRHDYHATRSALAEAALFRPLFRWHEERGLLCGFDQQGPARAGYPIQSVQLYADYPRTHRWYSAPGSDHHGEAKIHSSLAHLYDRPRVWIEAFHSSGWGGTLEETFDWLLPWIRAGATLYDPHAVYYSTRGGWWEWAPPSTDWRQPYWKHYHVFAQTVSRLCSVLTLGHHVSDIGVLFPTTTVQAGLLMSGFTQDAQAAHELYLRLVGKMHWYKVEPGVLDRACRDFDVLDDASIQRGEVRDGRLHIGEERYRAIVLPGCTVLEDETAARLGEFVEGGGTLVAVGSIPHLSVGTTGGSAAVQQLTALFERGRARSVSTPEELVPLLAAVPAQIEAAVPTLVRQIGQATVVFVPAISPRATRMRSEQETGVEAAWLNVDYTFDPSTYHRVLTVRVHGIQETPELWEPCSGRKYLLEGYPIDSGIEVHVPFDDSPGVLLVWPGEQDAERGLKRRGRFTVPTADVSASGKRVTLPEVWAVDIEPTLDNRWGDFALPATTTFIGVERWVFRHRVDASGQTGLNEHWFNPEWDDSDWPLVHATFGPHGLWTGPVEPERLPAPLGIADEWDTSRSAAGQWREAIYSLSRGMYKDPLHQRTLGPKGHIPEEFLDFGWVRAGEAVQFRATFDLAEPLTAYLVLGAPAQKTLWVNGTRAGAAEEDKGYLFFVPVRLKAGLNLLEFRLQAEMDGAVRAHFAFVTEPTGYGRPEWVQASGTEKDTLLIYTKGVGVPFRPERAIMYVAAGEPCRIRVNGAEIGVQGGFDPYPNLERPHIQRYDLLKALREGENLVELEVTDLGASGYFLVDALIESDGPSSSPGGGSRIVLMSDEAWQVTRNGRPTALEMQRKQWLGLNSSQVQWLTLNSLQVWQRPHPLPTASWLENAPPDETVLSLVPDVREEHGCTEWLRFVVPPGAVRMHLRLHGGATVYLDGVEQRPVAHTDETGLTVMEVNLPDPTALRRVCALRVETRPGYRAGGILDAPVRFEMTTGMMKVGSWEEQGLVGYSGGVRYRQTLVRDNPDRAGVRTLLDLGRVRGTTEVHVNGELVGIRIWSPYVFDLTDHLRPGENELHVSVYNTLGPYMKAISPTPFVFPGQTVSGLLGPVTLTERD